VAKDQKEMKLWVELFYPFTVDAENEVPRFPRSHMHRRARITAPPHRHNFFAL